MPRKRSYAWALAFSRDDEEVQALSAQAREGLDWAMSLAQDARLRSAAALAGESYEPLTVAELAAPWNSPVEVHTAIKRARIELFGKDLSNSAIAYRLKQRREREARTCAESGCQRRIAALAHGSRRFCPRHGSVHARVARHRRGTSAATG
jgi:hypothetical protein